MADRLSFEERARIEAMTEAGVPTEEIAERLGRHRSTVYRELKRSGCDRGYDAETAQQACDRRARRPKQPKLVSEPQIAKRVRELPREALDATHDSR